MRGTMPESQFDTRLTHDGWTLYIGVWADDAYTEAQLVVEQTKGGGKIDGDPKSFGPTWRKIAGKQIDYDAGERMTPQQRAEWLEDFRVRIANPALATWAKSIGSTTVPEAPKEFWAWLSWSFRYRMALDSATCQLVTK